MCHSTSKKKGVLVHFCFPLQNSHYGATFLSFCYPSVLPLVLFKLSAVKNQFLFACFFSQCLETNTSVVHDPSSMKSVHDDTYGCPIGIKLLKTYINVCFQILYLLPHRTNLNSTRSPRPRNSSAQDHS